MIAEKTRLADKARLRPCSDCQELLRFDVKLGWVHISPGVWLFCPSRGEPQPVAA